MKKLLTVVAAAAIVTMAGTAMAATANLAVSATIANACSVTGGTLSFGALNTLTAPVVNASSSGVSITCTKGDAYTVETDYGVNSGGGSQAYLKNTTNSDTIPYSVSFTSPAPGTGAAQTLTINGNIASGSYSTASAGTYNDTMVITVTP